MAEERYVDPNSGAAPQPGGYAGAHAVEAGHGTPGAAALITDGQDSSYEDEQQASADKALETEAVNLPASSAEGSDAETDAEGSDEEDTEEDAEEDAEDEGDGGGDYTELLSGKVDDVNAYVEAHPDEKDAVLEAEKSGQNRKGIVEA